MLRTWFSIFDFSFDYKGAEPPFASLQGFGWAAETEQHYAEIKKELNAYLSAHSLQSYFNASMVAKKDSWKTISLKTWDIELFKVQKHFPYLSSVLKRYPEIVSASFSLLEPNSTILPHCGDTNAIYRCHFGIEVPAGLPGCGLKVKGEDKAWEEGKWFAFMDAYRHEAWNNTDKARLVFIIDVMRPEFVSERKYVCSTVRTSLFLQRRVKDITSKPVFIKISATILRPFIRMGIATANLLKFY